MTAASPTSSSPAQMSLGRSALLHLLPGALLTTAYFLIAPAVMASGYPPLAALFLVIAVVLVPLELGYLLYLGYRRNGKVGLQGVVVWREPLRWTTFLWVVPLLIIWGSICFVGLAPLEGFFASRLFAWMPAWSLPSASLPSLTSVARDKLIITLIAGFVFNGFAGPVVEELYFRGFLLPRVARFGSVWAVIWNVVLFSLYHFFSPWGNVTRILALIPIVAMVARKRNIYVGMWTHCLLNTLSMLAILGAVFGG